MNIDCKQCGRPIPADDVNIKKLIAKCGSCHAVFGFSNDIEGRRSEPKPRGRYRREKVPLPKMFHVEDTGLSLRIVHRWFRPVAFFLVFFCLMWFGMLALWYSEALRAENTPRAALIFPLMHVAAGVGLLYFALAGFVNRTVIDVSGQSLNIRHTPLPWLGGKSIPSHTLDQLYVVERTHRSRRGQNVSYQLRAIDKNGKSMNLLSAFARPEQALYLEQAIETRLGIEDQHVPGQIRT